MFAIQIFSCYIVNMARVNVENILLPCSSHLRTTVTCAQLPRYEKENAKPVVLPKCMTALRIIEIG